MKKKGITLTEILVAVTIFSLGIVPLMLSLNSSFKATVFNRDYTKAMEYNAQLIEEIAAMMPTKVSEEDYGDLEELKKQVERVVEARSENNATKKGIYPVLEGSGSNNSFNFKFDEIPSTKVDHKFYRVVKVVDEKISAAEEEESITLNMRIDNLYTKDNKLVARSNFAIKLESSESDETGETGSGNIGGIEIHNKENSVVTDVVVSPDKVSNFIHVKVHAETGNVIGKFASVEICIDGGRYQTLNYIKTEGKDLIFEKGQLEIPAGVPLEFRLSRSQGSNGNLKLSMEYHLYNINP